MSTIVPRIKYLTNKEFLLAIHESKCTFCEFDNPRYSMYDMIVHDLAVATPEALEAARQKKLDNLKLEERKLNKSKTFESQLTLDNVPLDGIVVRLMTYSHIPTNPDANPDKIKTTADRHMKVNFPPFQHFIWENDSWRCVGRSHHKNGAFSITHGRMTNKLGAMFMKLAEKYGTRGNWRGYCVDESTQALTSRGWLGIDEITTDDMILSYDEGDLKWSKIKSVYRGDYDGNMHRLTVQGLDCLITPGHKKVTDRGLVPVEYLLESDHLILMGKAENTVQNKIYPDSLVELVGWIVTEGCYEMGRNGSIKNITIYQNEGIYADRIRNCLNDMGYTFSEHKSPKNNIGFRIWKESSEKIVSVIPTKNLNMDFLTKLTKDQRSLLLETMIDGDGWRVQGHKRYVQKDPHHVDQFQALCALLGLRTNAHHTTKVSFNKPTSYYNINVFSTKKNTTKVSAVNFHGGKVNNRKHIGKGKIYHPNQPTEYYKGRVWCPETEYGCFLARRNHTVYLTGNTYVDEMKAQAIVQLAQVGLQFDESRSNNPFSWATQVVYTSFLKVLNTEKKSQSIRDDLLIMAGSTPSHTRQVEDQMAQQALSDAPAAAPDSPEDSSTKP